MYTHTDFVALPWLGISNTAILSPVAAKILHFVVTQALLGDEGFLGPKRLKDYNAMRNDPCSPKAVSTLSAYLHFGHISGQRVALEANKLRSKYKV